MRSFEIGESFSILSHTHSRTHARAHGLWARAYSLLVSPNPSVGHTNAKRGKRLRQHVRCMLARRVMQFCANFIFQLPLSSCWHSFGQKKKNCKTRRRKKNKRSGIYGSEYSSLSLPCAKPCLLVDEISRKENIVYSLVKTTFGGETEKLDLIEAPGKTTLHTLVNSKTAAEIARGRRAGEKKSLTKIPRFDMPLFLSRCFLFPVFFPLPPTFLHSCLLLSSSSHLVKRKTQHACLTLSLSLSLSDQRP